jgi:tetratricopeptide (TPR) repeat protein
MKNRKQGGKVSTFEQAENYHNLASDIFIYTESDDPNYRRKIETAIANMRRALLIDPDNYEFLVFTGVLLDALDDQSAAIKALEYYDRAIRLRPEHPDAYKSKAGALIWAKPPDEANAERLARKAVDLARKFTEDPEGLQYAYMTLLDVLEARNKFGELRWTILKARKDCPTEFMKDITDATLEQIAAKDAKGSKEP